jgi:hypothetical protein
MRRNKYMNKFFLILLIICLNSCYIAKKDQAIEKKLDEQYYRVYKRLLFSIDSTRGWLDTTIDVHESQILIIEYKGGLWSVDFRNYSGVDANGYINENDLSLRNWMQYKYFPKAPFGALIGAIGDKTKPFTIGSEYINTRPENGRLYLRINDSDEALGDNKGSIEVSVMILTPASCR